MELLNVDILKAHPKNDFFFDDIQGENWKEFLESVKTRGVIEPIVITPDKVIVSGHQRVRACKELGIETIKAEVRLYDTEDQVIQDLIETNLRQRGVGNPNAVKLGRCIKELERIYGVREGSENKKGSNRIGQPNNSVHQFTQSDIAAQIGISVDTLQNYKKLSEMIPELEELVKTGVVSTSTALAIIKGIPKDEQESFIASLDTTKRITQRQVQGYIAKIKELENRPQKEVIKEVVPADYEKVKKECASMKTQYEDMAGKWRKAEAERKKLQAEKDDPKIQEAENVRKSALLFNAGIANFIEKFGGYVWLTQYLDIMPEQEKRGFLSGVNAIKAWIYQMENNLGGMQDE